MTATTATKEADSKPQLNKQKSYFSKNKINRYILDDGTSYIEHTKLDEGTFEAYQDLTSRIKLDREGETTEVDMKLGATRKFLLENLVTGWNLVDEDGDPITFAKTKVFELEPHIIGGLIQDIYKQNSILGGEEEADAGKETSKS